MIGDSQWIGGSAENKHYVRVPSPAHRRCSHDQQRSKLQPRTLRLNGGKKGLSSIFLDERPRSDALRHATGRHREEMRLGAREIFVHYVDGIGGSKLAIPAARNGTGRNINTVAKLGSHGGEERARVSVGLLSGRREGCKHASPIMHGSPARRTPTHQFITNISAPAIA